MNDFVKSVILGIVEGITEFLPVSSTGHLIIANEFLGFTGGFAHMFDVVIQLGAILSVVVYFRRRLFPFYGSAEENKRIIELWIKAVLGVVPALFMAALAGNLIHEHLFNPIVVAVALIAGGIALFILERRKSRASIESIDGLGYRTVLLIGLFQCLSMVPGTSRSAATIIGAMLLGCSRMVAAEFSFFLAVPTMAAASVYSVYKFDAIPTTHEIKVLAAGFAVSFLVAWAVIAAFIRYISRKNFLPFAYYRIFLGFIVLFYFYILK
jgi:undecaprenyl-diphosphatase